MMLVSLDYRSPQGQQWKQRQQNKGQQPSGVREREVKPKRAEGEEGDILKLFYEVHSK